MIGIIIFVIFCIFVISSLFASITLYLINNVKVSRMNGSGVSDLKFQVTSPPSIITQQPVLDQVIYNISNDITWSNYGAKSGSLHGNQTGLSFTQQLPDLPSGSQYKALAWNGFYKIGCTLNGSTQYTNPYGPVCSDDTSCQSGGQGPKIRISANDNDINHCAKQGGIISVLRQRPVNGDYTNVSIADDSKYIDITNNLQNANLNGPYNGKDPVFTDTYQIDSNNTYITNDIVKKVTNRISMSV